MIRPIDREVARLTQGCESAVDLGCMFGQVLSALPHVPRRAGVEIFGPYLDDRFRDPKAEKICGDVRRWIREQRARSWDAVLMIDFVEHLDEKDAVRVMKASKRVAAKIAVVFTPLGMVEQSPERASREMGDRGGVVNYAQQHRSGWSHEQLQELGFETRPWRTRAGRRAIIGAWRRP